MLHPGGTALGYYTYECVEPVLYSGTGTVELLT